MSTAENAIHLADPPGRRKQRPIVLLVATSVLLLACLVWSASALAAPANDDFTNATAISTLPLSATVDMADAASKATSRSSATALEVGLVPYTPANDGRVSITTSGLVANGR